jgi:hypothetical protein
MIVAVASLGGSLPLWSVAPFVLLLAAVAVLEVVAGRWWSSLTNKAIVATVPAAPAAAHLLLGYGSSGGVTALIHSLTEYVSFLSLLAALFVIAGGIEVRGSLAGTPLSNAGMLSLRRRPRQPHRHDQRRDGADPPVPASERQASSPSPPGRLLHPGGRERRGTPHPDR